MGLRREAYQALATAGLRPRKRWGQHFLCDARVAGRIVELAEIDRTSAVLEIGPGLGALTGLLAACASHLYLVEIDPVLGARLDARYADDPQVSVVTADFLTVALAELVSEPTATVIGNLPYNISTPILFRLLDLRARFPRAVLMLQREVATRFAARPGSKDFGVPSVLVQAFGEVRIAFGVSRRSFWPTPKVDSSVIEIRWSPTPRADIGDPEHFRAVVHAAFGQRRKMLRNALAALAADRGLDATTALERAGVDPRARAETLDLAAFARLARALS
jgi:16S rRNA (adenine1518-N6/adenine1519-N6)-dimethyltransferase